MEDCLSLAKVLGDVPESDWPKLEILCEAALAELRRRLRPGVTEADCGEALPLAGAFLALAGLEEGGEVERFSAGDLTIQSSSSGKSADFRRQAERVMAPWLNDGGFVFRGVRG